jgi:hypothetical protein
MENAEDLQMFLSEMEKQNRIVKKAKGEKLKLANARNHKLHSVDES